MKRRFVATLLTALLIVSLFPGCSGGEEAEVFSGGIAPAQNDYPVTIGDLTLNSSPEKVVVLSPSIADIILAVEMEIKLVGRSEECTQKELSSLPVVGSSTGIDAEAIKALEASLVLSDVPLSEEDSGALSAMNIPQLILVPATTREEFERLYSDIGSALSGGKTGFEQALKTARSIFTTLDQIQMVIPPKSVPVTACYLFSLGQAATGDTLAGRLFDYAGAINTAYDSIGGEYTAEQLVLSDPQFIFCAPGVKEELLENDRFSSMVAIREDRIYEMEPYLMICQGRSVTNAVVFLAGKMYPELSGQSGIGNGDFFTESETNPPESSASSNEKEPSEGKASELKLGDEGDEVRRMQKRLDELGYMPVAASGYFGEATEQAVKNFQLANGLLVHGIANEETLALLYSEQARSNPY